MQNTLKPTKITFKKTEAEWYNYHNTLKEIAKLREGIMNPFDEEPDTNTGSGSNSVRNVTNPTERIVTRLSTNKQLQYLTEIVEVIEQVYNALPEDYKKLVRLRYWNKNKNLTWEKVAADIPISERQARRWRKEIIQATVELLGWR